MRKPDRDRLTAAHRQTAERAIVGAGQRPELLLDERDHVLQEILRERRVALLTPTVAAAPPRPRVTSGPRPTPWRA